MSLHDVSDSNDMSHTLESTDLSPFITNPSVRLQEGFVHHNHMHHQQTASSVSSDTRESSTFESDVSLPQLFQDAAEVNDNDNDDVQTTPKALGSVTDNIGLKMANHALSTQAIIFSALPTKADANANGNDEVVGKKDHGIDIRDPKHYVGDNETNGDNNNHNENNDYHNPNANSNRFNGDIHLKHGGDNDYSDTETNSPLLYKTRPHVTLLKHATVNSITRNKRESWRSIRPLSLGILAASQAPHASASASSGTTASTSIDRFSLRKMPANVLSAQKVDELNKQVINYKIQVKFFKQFLQKLIEQSQLEGTSKLDLAELTQMQNNFNDLTLGDFSSPNRNTVAYTRLKEQYEELENNYDQVFKLNDDLYANLEIFQRQLQTREEELSATNSLVEDCQHKVDGIFEVLIADSNTDNDSRMALQRCLESVGRLPNKLEVLKLELHKRLELHAMQQDADREEVGYTVDTVLRLLKNVEHLETEYANNVKRTQQLEQQLKDERDNSEAIAKNFRVISEKFSDFSKSVEDKVEDNTRLRHETDKLISLNAELQSQNASLRSQAKSSETIVQKLQVQLGQEEAMREKQKVEIEELQQAHNDHQKALESNVPDVQEKELKELKELKQKFNDLDMSSLKGLEREYLLVTEKMNLSKSLRTLQSTISKQSETIMSLTRNNNDLKEQVREKDRKYSLLEYQLGEILSLDVLEFEKFFRAMQPITENENGIGRSIRQLSKGVENMKALIEAGDLKILREQHQGLFEYFSRAFKKLSKHYGEEVLKTMDLHEEWTSKTETLTNEVDSLKTQNQELRKEAADAQQRNKELLRKIAALESQAQDVASSESSGTTSGGTTDLVRSAYKQKWKSERESRMLEHNGSQRRVREAEQEIERLQRENANLRAMRNRSSYLQN